MKQQQNLTSVGEVVGAWIGEREGLAVIGDAEGDCVGGLVGWNVGSSVGCADGFAESWLVGSILVLGVAVSGAGVGILL